MVRYRWLYLVQCVVRVVCIASGLKLQQQTLQLKMKIGTKQRYGMDMAMHRTHLAHLFDCVKFIYYLAITAPKTLYQETVLT